MNWQELIFSMLGTLGLSTAAAYWLTRTLIQHRLGREMEERKAELVGQLDAQKAQGAKDLELLKNTLQLEQARIKAGMDADIRKAVETQLGELAAQRQYEYEARRRLYVAIGPLRFQLLLACRDLAGRMHALATSENYVLDLKNYYARSTIYRLLKPLALSALIEEQMTLADFSVDYAAIECLRFRRSITRILCGDELVGEYPEVDWLGQREHVFADTLATVAQTLIARPAGAPPHVLRFDEFIARLASEGWQSFAPFGDLLNGFEPKTKPLLWIRLVAYAHACNALVARQGKGHGFKDQSFDTPMHLQRSNNTFTHENESRLQQCMVELDLVSL